MKKGNYSKTKEILPLPWNETLLSKVLKTVIFIIVIMPTDRTHPWLPYFRNWNVTVICSTAPKEDQSH